MKTTTTLARLLCAAASVALLAAADTNTTSAGGGVAPAKVRSAEVIASLKGLVFLSRPQDLQSSGSSKTGVDTSAVKMLDTPAFQTQASKFLGHSVTLENLNEITHAVVAFYREQNHPLVEAVVPQQNVESGTIQVVVTEFKVGAIRPQGNRYFSNSIVQSSFSLKHGDTVDSARLVNELDAANTNPFRRVNLVYQPSSQPGYTDLVLQTQDRLPLRVFSGFDNNGTPVTGRNRWEMGATWGNALWHDQQISYQLSTSTDFFNRPSRGPGQPGGPTFQAQSLSWSIPVRGRDSITLFGNFARSVPNIGQDFGLVGKSWGASARYNLALHRTSSLTHTLSAGYDFKSTNNNLAFGGTQVMRNNTEINQFAAGYSAGMTDRWGSTALNTSLFFSPGNITPNNTDVSFQPGYGQSGRGMAAARYSYWRADLNRLTKLPQHMVYAFRLMGQTSTANLLYTEQLAGGGPEILRGYDPNALLGDRGIVMSNELRSPVFAKTSEVSFGGIQAVTFWDFAHLSSVHDVEGATNRLNGSSVGVGLRYTLRANLAAKSDYGYQLQHLANAASDRNRLLSFGFLLSY